MNKLVQIRKKIQKLERLHNAQLLATKNGEIKPYKPSVFEDRVKKVRNELNNIDA